MFYGWYIQAPGASHEKASVLPAPSSNSYSSVAPGAAYVVLDIPGKGKGAVAIRDIQVSNFRSPRPETRFVLIVLLAPLPVPVAVASKGRKS